ncbi:MAG: ABC transporter substrate-binding protein, partial [Coriobacteriia bacterium]|nr:ABC transporter substrate-binding protein [Coriobacteriia bacterium]
MTRLDSDLLPVPDLLVELPMKSNGGISEDGTSVVYRMTDDAVWHDGRPLDAYDVVFTWELLASGKLLDEPGVDTSVVRSFEAVDARTIRMELSRPDAPLIWRLLPYVLPRHALGDAVDP